MRRAIPIKISIPNPCSQNWAGMPQVNNAKFCDKCKHVIHDFTQMNDDELFRFMKRSPVIPCGRFHKEQLGREILPKHKKLAIFNKINKIAATLITIFSLKASPAFSLSKNAAATSYAPTQERKDTSGLMTDKVMIKGTVKEENGNPLQNAKVYMETIGDFFTNEKGEFTIEIDSANQISYTLFFSYEGLTTIVRNYHIAMQSTVYDIILHKPYEGWGRGSLGGAPIIEDLGELPSISFKSSSFILNSTAKALLSSISIRMKEHPDSEVKITAYGKTPKQIKLSHKRIATIKNYLEENEGISSDRLLEIVEEEGPSNIVDIK